MKNLVKPIIVLTVIFALVTLTSIFFSFLLPLYLASKFSTAKIGGADGPTAIYLTGTSPFLSFTFLFVLGIISLFVIGKLSKKK